MLEEGIIEDKQETDKETTNKLEKLIKDMLSKNEAKSNTISPAKVTSSNA